MNAFGSRAFNDPEDVFSTLLDVDVDLVLTSRIAFGARVSWLALRSLRLCAIEEDAPRVAFISLPSAPLFISFPLVDDPAPVWNGIRLQRGDLVLHGPGDRFHHRTSGPARWGLISILPRDLAAYGRVLLDRELASSVSQVLRPPARTAARLLRLLVQARRLAATRPKVLAGREVRRALEQELIHALVLALATEEPAIPLESWRRRSEIMVRFEDALARQDRTQPLPLLCAGIGVPPRTLREYCVASVGFSPIAYARLRRLNFARSALLNADPAMTNVTDIARSYGFSQPGRFAIAYRALFGESPQASLRRSRSISAEYA